MLPIPVYLLLWSFEKVTNLEPQKEYATYTRYVTIKLKLN